MKRLAFSVPSVIRKGDFQWLILLTQIHKHVIVFPLVNADMPSLCCLTETWCLFFSSLPINPVLFSVFIFLQFGYEGRVPLKSARLFYDISEKARKIVESYFMLNSTLYFSYTHMVCRTALSGKIPECELVLFHPQ